MFLTVGLLGDGEIGVRGSEDLAAVVGMVSVGTASASLGPRRAIILIWTSGCLDSGNEGD